LTGSDASTAGRPRGAQRRGLRYAPEAMLIPGSEAFGQTVALLITFGGVGIVVNLLIVYIVAQVLAERRQNREYREFREGP
jgi:hypothetical protein